MKLNKELLKGNTSMLILSLLMDRDMYGYQIIKELSQKSEKVFEFKEGTLYPILHALEDKNYVFSYWNDSGTKKRKYYSITTEGKKHLREKRDEWKSFSAGVNLVLGGNIFEY